MTLSESRRLYKSSNGDVWTAATNDVGRLVVIHEPNRASGGKRTEVDAETFLDVDHYGPEHEALLSLMVTK